MRRGMLQLEVELAGAVQVSGLIEREDAGARLGVPLVRCPEERERRCVGGISLLHLVEEGAEGLLRGRDLRVVRVVLGQDGHRPVMTLGRHRVQHLLRSAGLLLEPIQVLDPFVHPADHDEAEHRHRDEEQRAGQEAEQQLGVDARPDPGDAIHDRSQPAREAGQSRFGDRHRGSIDRVGRARGPSRSWRTGTIGLPRRRRHHPRPDGWQRISERVCRVRASTARVGLLTPQSAGSAGGEQPPEERERSLEREPAARAVKIELVFVLETGVRSQW